MTTRCGPLVKNVWALVSMLPQVAVGGLTPSPRKLRPDSTRIRLPMLIARVTATIENRLGIMCTNMIRRSEAPIERAQTMNSRVRSEIVSPRTRRITPVQPISASTSTSASAEGENTAAMISSRNR